MDSYYQHDTIYKKNKDQIIQFIEQHQDHYILTDGIMPGDGQMEKFYMTEILNTPDNFSKKYKNVLHLRLEDVVALNLFIDCKRVINLLDKINWTDTICIVCKRPTTDFENDYIKQIVDFVQKKNIKVVFEHNDVMTDYYIMKSAENLICAKSTLSWCAAFFSTSIVKCYLPEYNISSNCTCQHPIDNTELY